METNLLTAIKEDAVDAVIINEDAPRKTSFIEANTEEVTLEHLKKDCIIPVFSRDNEVCISHQSFIGSVHEAVRDFYKGEKIEDPIIRVSHIVKGRIPSAINKPVKDLLESDRTMYYERMIFEIQVPTIHQDINGNHLTLSVVGCKSYARDNLAGRFTAQKFSMAVGFQNMVCTNQCISTDGYREDIRAMNEGDLYKSALDLFGNYNIAKDIHLMQSLGEVNLNEHQFCQILGRMRMYSCLSQKAQKRLPLVSITDSQINNVAKQYLNDSNFAGGEDGISMWRFYNLLTGAVKNSYADTFLSRTVNAMELSVGLSETLQGKDERYAWFLG